MRNANWKWPLTGPFLCVQSAEMARACAHESAKSALPPTADEQQTSIYVGLGPEADYAHGLCLSAIREAEQRNGHVALALRWCLLD